MHYNLFLHKPPSHHTELYGTLHHMAEHIYMTVQHSWVERDNWGILQYVGRLVNGEEGVTTKYKSL